jgi:HSP20 family protein
MALPTRHEQTGAPARRDLFEELGHLNRRLAGLLESWRSLPNGAFTPLADVEEVDDAYVVEIELPGVKRDHVDIEVADRRISVHGERKERERVGILRKRERTVGRFHYEVILPGDIDEEGIKADLDEGVLTVRLPKPEREQPRRIEIR